MFGRRKEGICRQLVALVQDSRRVLHEAGAEDRGEDCCEEVKEVATDEGAAPAVG
jgi:hypothetical protein